MKLLDEHSNLFELHPPFQGPVALGYKSNYLGVKDWNCFTGDKNWGYHPEYPPFLWFNADKPKLDDEYIEWLEIIKAARSQRNPVFRMLDLGAGWGRWSVRLITELRMCCPRPFHLTLVEAEPSHQELLLRHLADNQINPDKHKIISAALSASGETETLLGGGPLDWFGQSVDRSGILSKEMKIKSLKGEQLSFKADLIQVPAVRLSDILRDEDHVDFVDMDIQGLEDEVVREAFDQIQSKVARIHISTHNREIEEMLRVKFSEAGWTCVNDLQCDSVVQTQIGEVLLTDGIQTWYNLELDTKSRIEINVDQDWNELASQIGQLEIGGRILSPLPPGDFQFWLSHASLRMDQVRLIYPEEYNGFDGYTSVSIEQIGNIIRTWEPDYMILSHSDSDLMPDELFYSSSCLGISEIQFKVIFTTSAFQLIEVLKKPTPIRSLRGQLIPVEVLLNASDCFKYFGYPGEERNTEGGAIVACQILEALKHATWTPEKIQIANEKINEANNAPNFENVKKEYQLRYRNAYVLHFRDIELRSALYVYFQDENDEVDDMMVKFLSLLDFQKPHWICCLIKLHRECNAFPFKNHNTEDICDYQLPGFSHPFNYYLCEDRANLFLLHSQLWTDQHPGEARELFAEIDDLYQDWLDNDGVRLMIFRSIPAQTLNNDIDILFFHGRPGSPGSTSFMSLLSIFSIILRGKLQDPRKEDLKALAEVLEELAPSFKHDVFKYFQGEGDSFLEDARRWAEDNPDEVACLERYYAAYFGLKPSMGRTSEFAEMGPELDSLIALMDRRFSGIEDLWVYISRENYTCLHSWASIYILYLIGMDADPINSDRQLLRQTLNVLNDFSSDLRKAFEQYSRSGKPADLVLTLINWAECNKGILEVIKDRIAAEYTQWLQGGGRQLLVFYNVDSTRLNSDLDIMLYHGIPGGLGATSYMALLACFNIFLKGELMNPDDADLNSLKTALRNLAPSFQIELDKYFKERGDDFLDDARSWAEQNPAEVERLENFYKDFFYGKTGSTRSNSFYQCADRVHLYLSLLDEAHSTKELMDLLVCHTSFPPKGWVVPIILEHYLRTMVEERSGNEIEPDILKYFSGFSKEICAIYEEYFHTEDVNDLIKQLLSLEQHQPLEFELIELELSRLCELWRNDSDA